MWCVCSVCAVVACGCAAKTCLLIKVTSAEDSSAVDLYDSATGTWSTAQLSVGRWSLAATSVGKVAIFAGGMWGNLIRSSAVDLYDSATGTWSTAQLSVARWSLAATSVGKVAIFAGGLSAGHFNLLLSVKGGRWVVTYMCCVIVQCVMLLFVLRCNCLPSDVVHCRRHVCCGFVR